jgi:hypothetical protein
MRWVGHVARTEKSVTGRGGPYGCETKRLLQVLENRLTDGDDVVSFTRRPPFTHRKIPGAHICQEADSTPEP